MCSVSVGVILFDEHYIAALDCSICINTFNACTVADQLPLSGLVLLRTWQIDPAFSLKREDTTFHDPRGGDGL